MYKFVTFFFLFFLPSSKINTHTHTHIYGIFILKIISKYLLVKIAHRFLTENSQNYVDPGVLPPRLICVTPEIRCYGNQPESSLNKLEDRGEGGRVLNQQVSILKLFLE